MYLEVGNLKLLFWSPSIIHWLIFLFIFQPKYVLNTNKNIVKIVLKTIYFVDNAVLHLSIAWLLSLWLIGTVRAEPETVISRA